MLDFFFKIHLHTKRRAADGLVLSQLPVNLHWLHNPVALATENDLDVLNSLDLFLDKDKHRINSNDGLICIWGLSDSFKGQ